MDYKSMGRVEHFLLELFHLALKPSKMDFLEAGDVILSPALSWCHALCSTTRALLCESGEPCREDGGPSLAPPQLEQAL